MTDPLVEVSRRLNEVLGRRDLVSNHEAIGAHLAGKRVLITGAGGSIGSALAETLARAGTSDLTLLDQHENSLFRVRQHLRNGFPAGAIRYELADVRNSARLRQVFEAAKPEVIFHLAAYKHVPLAEDMPVEFASVNVLGARLLLDEALRAGVKKIVYPSTDKAVNPPSVYGATKRAVEILWQVTSPEHPEIELTVARLVNVLGAWGGVIETFARQIAAGQPVTITDRRMTRYWITMDEALLLLTTAANTVGSGRTLLLDLGEPIAVATVAERLWSILRPEGPLRVEYCGSRPGERLAEELSYEHEVLVRSDYHNLLQVQGTGRPRTRAALTAWLESLEAAIGRGEADVVRHLLFDLAREEVQ